MKFTERLEIIPYLSEFFRPETRAVWGKRRVKPPSHVALDSNVTLQLWSGDEGGEVGAALYGWFLVLKRSLHKFSLR